MHLQIAANPSVLCCHRVNTNGRLGGLGTAIPLFAKLRRCLLQSSRESRVRSPTLNVMTRQRRRRRQRRRQRRSTDDQQHQQRHHADCRRGDGETRCCRYPLWVSFREIGWDRWILAPDGYRAYYCDGACPPRHRVATHYAGIRALVNGARPDVAPPPCCAATRMRPLTIAHYNHDGRAVVSVFDDMIVDECMCTWAGPSSWRAYRARLFVSGSLRSTYAWCASVSDGWMV